MGQVKWTVNVRNCCGIRHAWDIYKSTEVNVTPLPVDCRRWGIIWSLPECISFVQKISPLPFQHVPKLQNGLKQYKIICRATSGLQAIDQ